MKTTSFIFVLLFFLFLSSAAYAQEFQKKIIEWKSNKPQYSIKVDARIQFDFGTVNSDKNKNFSAHSDFRRLRFALKGNLYQEWAAEVDLDFSDDEDDIEIKDLWLAYKGKPQWQFTFGNHKPYFSLAELTSSRWYNFLEVPAPVEVFGAGRKMALSVSHWSPKYYVGMSVFGDDINIKGKDSEENLSERQGYAGRVTINPFTLLNNSLFNGDFHIGYSFINHPPEIDKDYKIKYNARAETRVVDHKLLDTGKLENVDRITSHSIELLYQHQVFSLQAEWLKSAVDFRDEKARYHADGYYFQASYFITGYGRTYQQNVAELSTVNIGINESAIELIARYSHLDLNDEKAKVSGGNGEFYTLGINWYANYNLAFMINVNRAKYSSNADGNGDYIGNDKIDILAMRVQYAF